MGQQQQPHRIVVGLGFGDEAKGATTDYLCSLGGVSAVVRFNGGGQAAHNVIADGKHHTFRQFGSGTLAGVPTFLSRFFLLNPWHLAAESEELAALGMQDPLNMVTVSPEALVVTPVHIAANRTREDLRGGDRHGSCGLGIGETVWYDLAAQQGLRAGEALFDITAAEAVTAPALRVKDCLDPQALREKLIALTAFYAPLIAQGSHEHPTVREMALDLIEFAHAVRVRDDAEHLAAMSERGSLVFEGAQGVLLDEWRGFHPHTTWSTTLPANAQTLLRDAGLPRAEVIGVMRACGTRHGAGPFPTEDPTLAPALPEAHNGDGTYQGGWRVGHLDIVALRYAAEVCREHGGLDGIALTHADVVAAAGGLVKVALDYEGSAEPLPLGEHRDLLHQEKLTAIMAAASPVLEDLDPDQLVGLIERELGAPVVSVGRGPRREDRSTSADAARRQEATERVLRRAEFEGLDFRDGVSPTEFLRHIDPARIPDGTPLFSVARAYRLFNSSRLLGSFFEPPQAAEAAAVLIVVSTGVMTAEGARPVVDFCRAGIPAEVTVEVLRAGGTLQQAQAIRDGLLSPTLSSGAL